MLAFNLDIITPEGKLFEGECLQVNIPGKEGRFGVLAAHMDLIANIKPGIVEVYLPSKEVLKMAVFSGITEIKSGKCALLVEKGIDLRGVNLEQIKEKSEFSKHQLQKANTETMRAYYTEEVEYFEQVLLEVSKGKIG
jgi:F-type H+-transporting ATPase subunit epsilon